MMDIDGFPSACALTLQRPLPLKFFVLVTYELPAVGRSIFVIPVRSSCRDVDQSEVKREAVTTCD
jgi:hypothetical protein